MAESPATKFTFCLCTYNSAKTIRNCLEIIKRIDNRSRVIVVDHKSEDETCNIASEYGCEIRSESQGLGYARQLCIELVATQYIVFVDADVEICRSDFLRVADLTLSQEKKIGAVVGLARGHIFAYGMPASLLVLRKSDFLGEVIPKGVNHRETYFIQRRLDELGLATKYLYHSIVHDSQFRKFKPELIGANTRTLPSPAYKELGFAFKVVFLLSLNSRNLKNIAYIPIFYMKFVRGFSNPTRWFWVKRYSGSE